MEKSHYSQINIGKEKDIKPKVDHNINLAGLLITDADRITDKLEREKEGLLKGLYVFRKKIPTGEVCICNGAEFPNVDAVDFLLYLISKLEENNWERKLTFKSLRELIREIYGTKNVGKTWGEQIRRALIIWKNHAYYFPKSFMWHGHLIETFFGVIEDWEIKTQGRGKPAKITITFNEKFVEICKNTDWYRRPSWIEIKKLRKETAKSLYLLALEYKPDEETRNWKIYMDNNLKYWYRNALNSLANPKHLRPSRIKERIKKAIEEINEKTNLQMELKEEEGNYYITVKEICPAGTEALEIPFDKLSDEEKALLVAYAEAVKEKKKINNIWGFLRSLSTRQIKSWLKKANKYFNSEVKADKETEFIEKPKLIEFLKEWGKEKFAEKPFLYDTYFEKSEISTALESNKKIVFKCKDEDYADFLNSAIVKKYGNELKKLFSKEVVFEG